ncbi:uncharacterized protein LOC124158045 isoform X2 [Ischnura elegans]|nr:uncharacterized protein LOC124158045 isoform X2 [Ischnura elegans]
MKEVPKTSEYIEKFKAGLQNVEAGWSGIVLIYAVLNVVLFVAILSGSGPFRIVLRPALVYPELIANIAILVVNHFACGVPPMKTPKLMYCFLLMGAKIMGIALGTIRWLLTFCIWWYNSASPGVPSSPASSAVRRYPSDGEAWARTSSDHIVSSAPYLSSDVNFRRMLRRRMTKSMASESHIASQLSRMPFLSRGRGFERPHRSTNSILDSLIVEDWEGEVSGQPPAVRARRYLSKAGLHRMPRSIWDEADTDQMGTDDWSKEREVIRRACSVICIAMAPESVVLGWLPNTSAPKSIPQDKVTAYYDDWRGLLQEARALHMHKDRSNIVDEYRLLNNLCNKVIEYRLGPRISYSTGSIEDDDDPAWEVLDEAPMGPTPGQMAARGGEEVIGAPDRLVSVESFLFGKLADVTRAKSFPGAVRQSFCKISRPPIFKDSATKCSQERESKGVQVNTLSEITLRSFYDGDDQSPGSGVPAVSSRDASVQVDNLPPQFMKANAA